MIGPWYWYKYMILINQEWPTIVSGNMKDSPREKVHKNKLNEYHLSGYIIVLVIVWYITTVLHLCAAKISVNLTQQCMEKEICLEGLHGRAKSHKLNVKGLGS